MKVYLVFRTTTEHHSNDLCWDDGWYDDYYEDITVCEHLVGVYATRELAEQIAEREDNKCGGEDRAYYVECEVLEEDIEDEEVLYN